MKHTGRRGGTSVKARRHQADEARYRVQIPSREEILAALEGAGRPLDPKALYQALGIDDAEVRNALGNRLRAMIRDGQIIANRRGHYCLVGHIGLVTGIVTGHRDGYGFVTPDGGGEDIYLPPRRRDHMTAPPENLAQLCDPSTEGLTGFLGWLDRTLERL